MPVLIRPARFQCDFCAKVFVDEADCFGHIRADHGIDDDADKLQTIIDRCEPNRFESLAQIETMRLLAERLVDRLALVRGMRAADEEEEVSRNSQFDFARLNRTAEQGEVKPQLTRLVAARNA